jgi:hypothetical protein
MGRPWTRISDFPGMFRGSNKETSLGISAKPRLRTPGLDFRILWSSFCDVRCGDPICAFSPPFLLSSSPELPLPAATQALRWACCRGTPSRRLLRWREMCQGDRQPTRERPPWSSAGPLPFLPGDPPRPAPECCRGDESHPKCAGQAPRRQQRSCGESTAKAQALR